MSFSKCMKYEGRFNAFPTYVVCMITNVCVIKEGKGDRWKGILLQIISQHSSPGLLDTFSGGIALL